MSATLVRPELTPSEAPAPKPAIRLNWALAGVLTIACVLAAAYSVVVPPFEAPDEPGHYAYVEWLLDGHGIPLQGTEPPPLQPEFSQPPLYYLIETPLAWLAGRQPANLPDWEARHNPFQNATDFGNVNLFLHSPAEAFPWTGAVLGLHLMRLANVVFVALMVLATYGCARELGFAPPVATISAAAIGFTPQLSFIGGVLNADNAIGSFSALAFYLLLRWLKRAPSLLGAGYLGLALGAAALSKLSGLAAVSVGLGFMGLRWLLKRDGRSLVCLLVTAVLASGVAGWWYVRNWLALGDPLGWSAMLPATGDMLRPAPLSFAAAGVQLLRRWYTGLAIFGWANLEVHWLWYLAGLILIGWAAVGLVLAIRRHFRRVGLAELALIVWPLAFTVSLVRWVEVNTAADQWRLLFPAFPGFTLLLVTGLRRLVFGLWTPLLAIPGALLILNAGSLVEVLTPAYAAPQYVDAPVDHPTDLHFGSSLQLVGYSKARPLDGKTGESVEVDLYWRTTTPMAKDYATDLAAVDAQGKLTFKEQSVPDEGRAPMTAWRPGATVLDRHRILVRPDMVGAQTLLLSVLDPVPPGNHLPGTTGDGTRLRNDTATLGRFFALPSTRGELIAVADNVTFGDGLTLAGHTIQQDRELLRVTLEWKATAFATKDYTVFVHMVAPDGRLVAQTDGQPGGGAFPTSLLGPGVEVPDLHVLDVSQAPPGIYNLDVGLYDLASGARLATSKGEASVSLPMKLS